MRLVSANLEHTAWPEKTAGADEWFPMVFLLKDSNADVVAVQECPGPDHLARLADKLGYEHHIADAPTGIHTGLLWRPEIEAISVGDKYAELIRKGTWHGFTSATLVGPGWPCPVTFISAHLIPHDVDQAVGEARFLQTRVRREGWPGVLVGDLNHGPLVGPEPNWEEVPEHNRASRTILDPDRPDVLRLDRRVGLALTRGGLVDVAAHLAAATGEEDLLAHTGVHGKLRVDQAWVTRQLVPAIRGYERLDHRGVTDHHPIAVDLALEGLEPMARVAFH